jgi:hypothetical protein
MMMRIEQSRIVVLQRSEGWIRMRLFEGPHSIGYNRGVELGPDDSSTDDGNGETDSSCTMITGGRTRGMAVSIKGRAASDKK